MVVIHIEFDKDKLIKSPLNYVGGKFKLLPQILPLFPDNINRFIDLFGGGFNVGINVNANKIFYNDTLIQVVKLLKTFKENNNKIIFSSILEIIKEYNLSDSTQQTYEDYGCNSSEGLGKHNKEAYLKLRDDYNTLDIDDYKKNIIFYTLICYSFSNQIRFNSKSKFNMPYGKRDFNKNLRVNLEIFLNKLHELDVVFYNKDFRELKINNLTSDDFVYCDPPYLITCASYNERGGWKEKDEKDLLRLLDELHNKNIKFALSNVLESKGNSNEILKDWSQKYNIHNLNVKYGNANYQRKEKNDSTTKEV